MTQTPHDNNDAIFLVDVSEELAAGRDLDKTARHEIGARNFEASAGVVAAVATRFRLALEPHHDPAFLDAAQKYAFDSVRASLRGEDAPTMPFPERPESD